MDDPDPDQTSVNGGIATLARSLISAAGGDPNAFDESMEAMGLGDVDDSDLAGAITAGASLGMELAEQRRKLRESTQHAQGHSKAAGEGEAPPIRVRGQQDAAGRPEAVRVLVADPDADLHVTRNGERFVVEGAGYSVMRELGVPAGAIEDVIEVPTSGISEFAINIERDDDALEGEVIDVDADVVDEPESESEPESDADDTDDNAGDGDGGE